jgi:hypothetical protein
LDDDDLDLDDNLDDLDLDDDLLDDDLDLDDDDLDVADDLDDDYYSLCHKGAHASHNCLVARPSRPRIGCATPRWSTRPLRLAKPGRSRAGFCIQTWPLKKKSMFKCRLVSIS